ncbi:MAG: hypothetical protein NUV45_09450 [Tepidanaerobacteraceae bacterium]|jgi:hypothetical protein|nr:hypothetical protein [Tepidanaerobacteraceae bacterium]
MKKNLITPILMLAMSIILVSVLLIKTYPGKTGLKTAGSDDSHKEVTGYQVKKITFPFRHFITPQLEGDKIYACISDDKKHGSLNKLIEYDIKTGDYKVLFETEFSPSALQNLMMNEKWMIWLDATMDLGQIKVYRKRRQDNDIKVIYQMNSNFENLDTPYLYKDYVCWATYDGEKKVARLKLYNLETDAMEDIYEFKFPSYYNAYPEMNDGKLVFTDHVDDKGIYLVLDLESRKLDTYESKFNYPAFASFSRNKIFSDNMDNYRIWGNTNFGVYDINTGEYTQIKPQLPDSKAKYLEIFTFRVKDNVMAIDFYVRGNEDRAKYIELYRVSDDGIKKIGDTLRIEGLRHFDFSPGGELLIGAESGADSGKDTSELYIVSFD